MKQILVTLICAVSLVVSADAQRRYSQSPYDRRSSRTSLQDESPRRFDPRNQYPTTSTFVLASTTLAPSTVRSVQVDNHVTSSRPKVTPYYSDKSQGVDRHHRTQTSTFVDNGYTADTRSFNDDRARNKYRRKPKQTYYPKVVSFYQKATANNGYEFKYVTADGVQRAERGYLSDRGVWTVEGSVTSLEDGNIAVVQSYVADASGYKASVKRYPPENFRSLDDFLPWSADEEFDDDKLGDGVINSLLGGGYSQG